MLDPYLAQEIHDLASASVDQEYLGKDEDERMRYLEQLSVHIEKCVKEWWSSDE